jgi:hypothetical protein
MAFGNPDFRICLALLLFAIGGGVGLIYGINVWIRIPAGIVLFIGSWGLLLSYGGWLIGFFVWLVDRLSKDK